MARIVQAADHLEPGQHAGDPVEPPAVDLGIKVTANQDRRQIVVAAVATAKDIAGGIHFNGQTGLFTPGPEQIAHVPVGIAKRQARQPAGAAFTDLA